MGIKLDWQVESEQSQVRATEDPEVRLRRQHARRQLLAVLAALVVVLAGVGGLVAWRLWSVNNRIRQDLLDTVEVEVTALRIGDFTNFMSIQRSASDSFLLEQSRNFEEYQQLKQTHRVELTGKVLGVKIDNQRGRVVLQEIIDGVPYQVVWFYWHYEDTGTSAQSGWRHVPDDLTFWGEAREISRDQVRVSYHALDERLAQALASEVDGWIKKGCAVLGCAPPLPVLHVEIVAERPKSLSWASGDQWTLRVTSPLVGRSRADLPFSPDLQHDMAQMIGLRLVGFAVSGSANSAASDTTPQPYTDTAWMQSELGRWLADALLNTGGMPGFTESLIAAYGPGAPGKLLAAVRSGASLDAAILSISGMAMAQFTPNQLNALNWRDFFQWRLTQEAQLVALQNSAAFLALYDQDNIGASSTAMQRLNDPTYAAQAVPQVVTVMIVFDQGQGSLFAYVNVTQADGTAVSAPILWRLSGDTWKREN